MIAPGTHKLVNVSEPREWESQYGPMKTFTVKFEGDPLAYQLNKKKDSPAPAIGQTLEVASVTPDPEGKWPAKIKLAQQNNGARGGGKSPEEQARIMRQHSQEMALRYTAIQSQRGKLADDFKVSDLAAIIDWFDADAKAAKP